MDPLDLVNLTPMMERTSGRPEIKVGLIDGPVVIDHPELESESIQEVSGKLSGVCAEASRAACINATFVTGILCVKRKSSVHALSTNCCFLVCPLFLTMC